VKTVAMLALVVLTQDAADPKKKDAMKGALQELAEGKGDLQKLVVTWDDLHGLHGGLKLTIRGDGTISQEAKFTKVGEPREKLDPKGVRELVDKLLALEAWVQKVPERPAIPDESRARLTISAGGESVTVWEWYNDLAKNKRLVEIRDLMQKLAWK
jgi:hypothetical protein